MIEGNLMKYIILNGINSKYISGLRISKLPSITKPSARTEIETIAGRDGDIVSIVGYSAYNKTFEISLGPGYNIDEIIDFFNSQGTVVFSNEPDKYYNYQIIDPIDFDSPEDISITMHVQPFKYSLVDNFVSFPIKKQMLEVDYYKKITNGIEISNNNNVIEVKGTAIATTAVYIPIHPIYCNKGDYVLNVYSNGVGVEACSAKLIYTDNLNVFNNQEIILKNNQTISVISQILEEQSYNCLYLNIAGSVEMDFNLEFNLYNKNDRNIIIRNRGNVISKPKITIYGSGTVSIELNQQYIFDIQLGNEKYITIDAVEMNAYKGEKLKNRLVTGNYNNLALKVGRNIITANGDISQIDVTNFSRWI